MITEPQLKLLGHDGRRAKRGWLYVYARDLALMVDRPHPHYPQVIIRHDPGSIMGNVKATMQLRYIQQQLDGDLE